MVRLYYIIEQNMRKTNSVAVRHVTTQISLGIAQSDQGLQCSHEE